MKVIYKAVSIVIGLLMIALILLLTIHNQYTDRINPFVKYETSYAKVSRKLQSYNNVTIYNSNGKKENYKLNHVGGYDPDGHYALIKHKGQYVNYMEYINENKFDNIVRNAD